MYIYNVYDIIPLYQNNPHIYKYVFKLYIALNVNTIPPLPYLSYISIIDALLLLLSRTQPMLRNMCIT